MFAKNSHSFRHFKGSIKTFSVLLLCSAKSFIFYSKNIKKNTSARSKMLMRGETVAKVGGAHFAGEHVEALAPGGHPQRHARVQPSEVVLEAAPEHVLGRIC